MLICKDRKIGNAHPHESHFQSCFRICDAANRMSRGICNATSLAKLHYNTACNLSCVTHKTPRFVLQNPHLDSGVGTFLLRIAEDLASSVAALSSAAGGRAATGTSSSVAPQQKKKSNKRPMKCKSIVLV